MDKQLSLFRNARKTDPATSHEAAEKIKVSAFTLRHQLLKQYAIASLTGGLTDEQAGHRAGMQGIGYWKRCSELRKGGYIAATGETRMGSSGSMQQVCAITEAGKRAIDG